MKVRWLYLLIFFPLLLTACGGDSTSGAAQGGQPAASAGSPPPTGYEVYVENGGIRRPDNAIDVFIVYSPESQQYLPEIIRQFNQAYANGTNPVTGQPLANGERPIFVWGTDPVSGSSGTVSRDIINTLTSGNYQSVYFQPTIFQPSVSHWLSIINVETGQEVFDVVGSEPTALSPVVIAAWQSRVEAMKTTLGKDTLGWDDILAVLNSPNGWCDFGVENCRRAVFFGQADPTQSSTGLSSAIEQYYACARQNGISETRLSEATVNNPQVQGCVRNLQLITRHYSRSTEDFLEYIGLGPDYLDFVAVEETDIICINTGAQQGDRTCRRPVEPLVAIYPEEGTFWHEHPFGILNAPWVTPEQSAAAETFTQFVISTEPQRIIMHAGFRPVNPDVPLEFPFTPDNGVTIEGPRVVLDIPETNAIVAIQRNWGDVKRQSDVLMLVDVSGSMTGDRMDQARAGIVTLTESIPSSSRIGLVSFSDVITIWDPMAPFENNVGIIRYHAICEGERESRIASYRYERCLEPAGSTSLYTALRVAVDIADATSNPNRIRAVVLLSDGEDTCEADGCATLGDVISKLENSRASTNPIIVIPIAYGISESSTAMQALRDIARASRTQVVQGDPSSILEILQLLSGYF